MSGLGNYQSYLNWHRKNFHNPYKVMNPEIYKSFYGKLNGKPHYYKITSNQEFMFYTGILIPKISEKVNTPRYSTAVGLINYGLESKLSFNSMMVPETGEKISATVLTASRVPIESFSETLAGIAILKTS